MHATRRSAVEMARLRGGIRLGSGSVRNRTRLQPEPWCPEAPLPSPGTDGIDLDSCVEAGSRWCFFMPSGSRAICASPRLCHEFGLDATETTGDSTGADSAGLRNDWTSARRSKAARRQPNGAPECDSGSDRTSPSRFGRCRPRRRRRGAALAALAQGARICASELLGSRTFTIECLTIEWRGGQQ